MDGQLRILNNVQINYVYSCLLFSSNPWWVVYFQKAGRQTGKQADRQNSGGFQNFKILYMLNYYSRLVVIFFISFPTIRYKCT